MRGRVMALYAIAFLGSTPIGAPLVGWISDATSPRVALLVGGVATLAAAPTLALRYVGLPARRRHGGWSSGRPCPPARRRSAGRPAAPATRVPALDTGFRALDARLVGRGVGLLGVAEEIGDDIRADRPRPALSAQIGQGRPDQARRQALPRRRGRPRCG